MAAFVIIRDYQAQVSLFLDFILFYFDLFCIHNDIRWYVIPDYCEDDEAQLDVDDDCR